MEILSFGSKAKQINAISILKKVLNEKKTKDFFISLNIHEQLFDRGIDANNKSLGEYSINTIEGTANYKGKKELGLPFDRVTLFHTGEFYNSFEVKIQLPYVIISANDVKDGTKLTDDYGKDIIGWTKESKEKAEKFILERVTKEIFSILFS